MLFNRLPALNQAPPPRQNPNFGDPFAHRAVNPVNGVQALDYHLHGMEDLQQLALQRFGGRGQKRKRKR